MTELENILKVIKKLAQKYKLITGKPLGVTGEIAEYEISKKLGLKLARARQEGWDAERGKEKIQIKGRSAKKTSAKVGAINPRQAWGVVMLGILDENYELKEIWEASKEHLTEELERPGSKARNERGQLSISQFKRAAKRTRANPIWPKNSSQ